MNHVTVGVYANDTYKVNIVKPEHLDGHIEYNKTMRFGRALFVNGECVHKGYLSINQIVSWGNEIQLMKFDSSKSSETYV